MSDKKRILFVDDEENVLEGIQRILRHQRDEWKMDFAQSVDEALDILNENSIDAVISDITMPNKDGFELLSTIRNSSNTKDIPVVILTGLTERGIKRHALEFGATDLLNKPADPDELIARIHNMLRLKSYQDEIKGYSVSLERKVEERTAELENAHLELIWRLARTAEYRDTDTGNHIIRVGYYSKVLAETLGMDGNFSKMILHTSPLHDIGKIGIPDNILLKPGRLDKEERRVMERHAAIGAEMLLTDNSFRVFNSFDSNKNQNPFLKMAATISLAHHERWDGSGYPSGLSEKDIPIEARIVAISDVYDALCSVRPYKPALAEEEVLSIMRGENGRHFDPDVFHAFEKAMDNFRDIRAQFSDDKE